MCAAGPSRWVIHCAGVNRGADIDVDAGNVEPARRLLGALRTLDRPTRVVYANTIHSRRRGTYGESKRQAAEILRQAPGGLSDVVLPNLFGEHCRPHYNSFVATFCSEVALGRAPAVVRDHEVPLLHAQGAAEILLNEVSATASRTVSPAGKPTRVPDVLRILREFDAVYRTGQVPDISSRFRVQLFNTYRSYLFPSCYPIRVPTQPDSRGALIECVRTGEAGGQAFVSSTMPGARRGEHVHLRKFERFLVVDGEAEISLRRLFTDEVVRFRVDGKLPVIVDMPTMWTHNISNVGARPVTTFFWVNELFSAADADTFPCPVEDGRAEAAA